MSNDVVIRVEELWKEYRYGTISHATLHKDLQSWWARVRGKEDPNSRIGSNSSPLTSNISQEEDRFWALQDINFEVQQGEVLGIIGCNGAGKSTLLKIMSRVTTPTKGQIKIKGRIASLLEVGTGFHPELTGRENIFLNGAILGMTKAEIRKKFYEIVAFAEIDKFIDTPVKRYSSGMYVRLAFAVAAHLEPEILIVDEVLAVGDIQFQKKCMGKMGAVAKEGRTVLFVSHSMTAIQALCTSVIHLKNGIISSRGETNFQIESYLNSTEFTQTTTKINSDNAIKLNSNLTLSGLELSPNPIESGSQSIFTIELISNVPNRITSVVILIYSYSGLRVAVLDLRRFSFPLYLNDNPVAIQGKIESLALVEGDYKIGLYIEGDDFKTNFYDLIKLIVNPKLSDFDCVPYPPNVRGVIELAFKEIKMEHDKLPPLYTS